MSIINDFTAKFQAFTGRNDLIAKFPSQLVKQAALSQPDISRGTQSLAKVVSINPTVIQYRSINYAQNQQGDWANQQTGRVPDESFQAFLDQELTRAGG